MDHRALRHCKARFAIDLHPSHCSDAMGGVQEQLNAWLLRYASQPLQVEYVGMNYMQRLLACRPAEPLLVQSECIQEQFWLHMRRLTNAFGLKTAMPVQVES